jgi:hypothetical protein
VGFLQAQTSVVFHIKTFSAKPPVEITQIFVDSRLVTPDTPIHVSGSWLSTVTVTVRNVSQKEAITSDLTLTFPETGTGAPDSPISSIVCNLGRWPAWAFRRKDGTSPPLPEDRQRLPEIRVAPGDLMRFGFSQYGDATQAQGNQKYGEIHVVDVWPPTTYFEDGSKWRNGIFSRYTTTPPQWINITPAQFAAYQGVAPAAQ